MDSGFRTNLELITNMLHNKNPIVVSNGEEQLEVGTLPYLEPENQYEAVAEFELLGRLQDRAYTVRTEAIKTKDFEIPEQTVTVHHTRTYHPDVLPMNKEKLRQGTYSLGTSTRQGFKDLQHILVDDENTRTIQSRLHMKLPDLREISESQRNQAIAAVYDAVVEKFKDTYGEFRFGVPIFLSPFEHLDQEKIIGPNGRVVRQKVNGNPNPITHKLLSSLVKAVEPLPYNELFQASFDSALQKEKRQLNDYEREAYTTVLNALRQAREEFTKPENKTKVQEYMQAISSAHFALDGYLHHINKEYFTNCKDHDLNNDIEKKMRYLTLKKAINNLPEIIASKHGSDITYEFDKDLRRCVADFSKSETETTFKDFRDAASHRLNDGALNNPQLHLVAAYAVNTYLDAINEVYAATHNLPAPFKVSSALSKYINSEQIFLGTPIMPEISERDMQIIYDMHDKKYES